MRLTAAKKLADKIILSIEHENKFYVGIILSISTYQHYGWSYHFFENNKYLHWNYIVYVSSPDVKVYKLSPLKRLWQENQMCENAADEQFRCYILKY